MAKKSETKVEPWQPAQKYILQGLENSGRVFDQTQPQLEGYAADQRGTYGRIAPGAEKGISLTQNRVADVLQGKNAGMNPGQSIYQAATQGRRTNDYTGAVGSNPASDYFSKAAGGAFLGGNPYLQANIDNASNDASNATNALFSQGGRYGSEAHQGTLAREVGRISSGMRLADYQNERGLQQNAASGLSDVYNQGVSQRLNALNMDESARSGAEADKLRAASLMDTAYNNDQARMDLAAGQSQDLMRGSQSLLDSAAALPYYGVGALNGNVRQASNGYGTTTSRTTDPAGIAMGVVGAAATAASGTNFSDKRIKSNIKKVGELPNGVALNSYTMPDGEPQIGVLAQDVEKKAPEAVGPTVGGIKTVNYKALGMPNGPMRPVAAQQSPFAGAFMNPQPVTTPGFGDEAGGIQDGQPVGLGGFSRVQVPRVDIGPIDPNIPEIDKRSGIQKFADRVLSPDASTTRGKIGLFGQALMAASGGPFAPLGNALMSTRADEYARMKEEREYELKKQNAGTLAGLRDAQGKRAAVQRINVPGVGLVEVDDEGTPTLLTPAPKPKPKPIVRNVPGVGLVSYNPETGEITVVQQSVPAPPRGAAGGGGGAKPGGMLTASQRGQAIAQAKAALAAGVPKEIVNKRLAELGVR